MSFLHLVWSASQAPHCGQHWTGLTEAWPPRVMLSTPQRWGDEAFCCDRAELESPRDGHTESCRRELAPWPRGEGRLALGPGEGAESERGHLEDSREVPCGALRKVRGYGLRGP